MIQVLLGCSKDGLLQYCQAQGHAGYAAKGFDIVCASATALLRTVLAQLEKNRSIELETKIPDRGMLAFSVGKYDEGQEPLLKYSFEFLECGIRQIQEEYPECIQMRVEKQ